MALRVALVILVALLALALEGSSSSIYRTVVAATDEEDNQGLQQCMQQVQQHMPQLQHCPQFLSRMFSIQAAQHLVECCLGLRNINEPSCRCWAVQEAVMQQQPEGGQEQMETMMQRARYLPLICGLGSQC